MIQPGGQSERHALPRWSGIQTAKKLGELASAKRPTAEQQNIGKESFQELLLQWKTEKNLPLAMEIISTARLIQAEEDISAIVEFAKESALSAETDTSLLKSILFDGEAVEGEIAARAEYSEINRLKSALKSYPRNPLLWCELSRQYTIVGHKKKSEQAILIAYGLAPENRTILRSIARFYTHVGDPERALYYLRKSALLLEDPWVLSAEIALTNKISKASKNIKRGRSMLVDTNFHPIALSELASELGTMDFFAGNSKQGKQKFEIAIKSPHENAVAQIAWVNENAHKVDSIIESLPSINYNFEAETRWHFYAHDWQKAFGLARSWQDYQPFSREPALVSSFIATDFLENYQEAEGILGRGLLSNPCDSGLLNNYAYVLILSGKIAEAERVLLYTEKLCQEDDYIPLIATTGLLSYRIGDAKTGRMLYTKAINAAKSKNNSDLLYRAALCHAREEKRCGEPITDLLKIIEDPKYAFLRKQYDEIIKNFNILG